MSIPIIKDKLDPRFSRNISSELFRISMSRIFVVSIRPINWRKVCWCRRSNINLIVSNKSCKQAILVLYQIIKWVRINLRTHSLSAQRWINLLSQSQHQLTLLMHRQQSLQCLFQPHQQQNRVKLWRSPLKINVLSRKSSLVDSVFSLKIFPKKRWHRP